MHVHTELCCQQSCLSPILPVYTHVLSVLRHQLDTEHQKEWEEAEKEREVKRRAVERARQELETRRRIEARLRAKQEMEEKAKREENGESDGGTARVVHCLVHDFLSFCTSSHTHPPHTHTSSHTHALHTHPPHTHILTHTHTLHTHPPHTHTSSHTHTHSTSPRSQLLLHGLVSMASSGLQLIPSCSVPTTSLPVMSNASPMERW